MSNKAELIEQLHQMHSFIYHRNQATYAIDRIDCEITRLKNESDNGVADQRWNATDNTEKIQKQINEELKQAQRKVSSKKGIILSIIFPCIIGLYGMMAGAGLLEYSTGLGLTVLLSCLALIVLDFPVLILPQIRARRRKIKAAGEMSAEQRDRLAQAEKTDKNNAQLNQEKKAQLDAELRRKNTARISELSKQRQDLTEEKNRHCTELRKYSILSYEDKELPIVSKLLEILRSNRADTLQEAFRILDEQKHREKMQKLQEEANRQSRIAQQKILDQMAENEAHRQEEAELLRQDMLRRQQAEEEHNREMERLAQKQIDELEKKRQEDRDYRRSGYIKGGG